MKRWLFLLAMLLWTSGVEAKSRFQFAVPAGWVDLSRDAPPSNFESAPPAVLEVAHSPQIEFYATDLHPSTDGILSNMNAVIEPSGGPIDEALIQKLAEGLDADVKSKDPSFSYKPIDRRLIQIQGLTAGRISGEFTLGTVKVRQLMIVVPGGTERAIVTYSASPLLFPELEPLFDKNAAAIQGLAAPVLPAQKIAEKGLSGALVGAVLGALAALIAGGIAWARRRR